MYQINLIFVFVFVKNYTKYLHVALKHTRSCKIRHGIFYALKLYIISIHSSGWIFCLNFLFMEITMHVTKFAELEIVYPRLIEFDSNSSEIRIS